MIEALYIDWLSLSTQLMMSYVQSSPILLGRFWRFLSFESNFWHKYHLICCHWLRSFLSRPNLMKSMKVAAIRSVGTHFCLKYCMALLWYSWINVILFDLFDKKHRFKSQEQERSIHRSEAATVYQNSWVEPLSR